MSYSDTWHSSQSAYQPPWALGKSIASLSITPSYCVSGVVNGVPGRLWHIWPVGHGGHAAGRVAVPFPSAIPGICHEKSEERVKSQEAVTHRQFELLSGPRSWCSAHSVTLAEDEWIGRY